MYKHLFLSAVCAATMLTGSRASVADTNEPNGDNNQHAGGATIFSDNFNAYSGIQDATQAVTGLPVAYGGDLPGWTKIVGGHAVHAVERSPGDWALMFINVNTVFMNTGVATNRAGVSYVVAFEAAPADYRGGQGTRTGTDSIRFEVLNPSDAVVASFDYFPGDFPTSGTNPFSSASFIYVGDGSGDVRLRIFDAHTTSSDHFGGAIDNLSISEAEDGGDDEKERGDHD